MKQQALWQMSYLRGMQQKQWFETWFDSRYYHILYKNRDVCEAETFIQKLVEKLQLNAGARVLDLACGKGRHAITLNKLGFDTTGADLSPQSIQHAKQFENDTLHFYVHDIRNTLRSNYYDAVLNLFTSFGYFDKEHDTLLAAKAMYNAVKKDGLLIIDFINCDRFLPELQNGVNETKEIDGIVFETNKNISNEQIVKKINVKDHDEMHHFEERLNIIRLQNFKQYFAQMTLLHVFGDYSLAAFDASSSPRLIMVFKK